MYVAEIRKKSFIFFLKCMGVYIILALTMKIPLTIGCGIISLIHSFYQRGLVKNNEIIDCGKYPHFKDATNFHCFIGVLWGVFIIFFHFYHISTYTG